MNFAFTEEQNELRQMARQVFDDLSPDPEVRRLMETADGFDRKVWAQLAEIGLLGLAVPEEYGGAGCGLVEVGVVMEEAGRVLLCAPYLSSAVVATSILLLARLTGDEVVPARLLPALAAGQRTATLAYLETSGRWEADTIATLAVRDGDGWVLSGQKSFVLDGHTADDLLVLARTSEGPAIFLVDASATGVERIGLTTLDQTRRLAALEFDAVTAELVGGCGNGSNLVSDVLDIAATALSAEQIGGAARVMEMAVEYAKVREQFGRPIGSFQAIKHACADMLLEVESGKSAAYYALWSAAAASPDFPVAAAVAKAYCSEAYFRCAAKNVQIHGGIGFTWEHPAHLYLKRSKSAQLLFGDPTFHRERVAHRVKI